MIEDHAAAVEDFTLLIKKNPKNAHAYFRRAFSNKALKVINCKYDLSTIEISGCGGGL
jgi:hypothetical protein